MKKKLFILFLFWITSVLIGFYFFPVIFGLECEAEAASLYYILDASGSMWGRVDGRMKIEASRDAMTKLIREMPEELLSGLTVYGHLKKGDCTDITELIPLGKIDRSKAVYLIGKLNPKGKTPIAATIEKTVQNLKTQTEGIQPQQQNQSISNGVAQQAIQVNGGETSIVLVSDGIETCGGDPCATTAALKSSGIKFVMHVVGFDVDKDASEQLSCIAKAGGGRYFSTQNAGELLSVLSAVQKSVVENRPLELPENPESEPTNIKTASNSNSQRTLPEQTLANKTDKTEQKITTSSKSIRIKAKGPGKITFRYEPWLKKPYSWKLVDPETGENKGRFSTLETTIVAPGYYQVVWDQYEHESSDVALTELIQVESGKTVEIPLMTAIRLNLPSWVAKPEYWGLRDPINLDKVVTFTKFEPFLVPAGEYELVWRQGEHSAREVAIQRVNIIPDKMNEVTISTAINPVPAQWVQKKIHYWGLKPVKSKDSLDADSEKFVAWFSDEFAPQLVPPGKYRLIYDLSEHGSSDSLLGEIEVVEGKVNDFQINTGVQLVPTQGMKTPYFVEFVPLNKDGVGEGGDKNSAGDKTNGEDKLDKVRINGSFGPIALKPGKYRINYRQEEHGASTITIVDEFDLEAGNLVEIEL